MSLISYIEKYENLARQYSQAHVISQFSGIILVDYEGSLTGQIQYLINDFAISFADVTSNATTVNVNNKITRAWALPGYVLEGVTNTNTDAVLKLPTLPIGTISTDPGDILLITAIPSEWYPAVPGGDSLVSYELKFNIPFFDIKNNRQFFKVKQHNVLEEGIIVLQLSALPATSDSSITGFGTTSVLFQ